MDLLCDSLCCVVLTWLAPRPGPSPEFICPKDRNPAFLIPPWLWPQQLAQAHLHPQNAQLAGRVLAGLAAQLGPAP